MPRPIVTDFEREKWLAECDFRERELKLREQDQIIQKEELRLKQVENARSRWSNPLVLAILATAAGALVNIGVVWWNTNAQRMSDVNQARSARDLEDQKAEAARILELVKSDDPDVNARNFEFLLDSRLVKSQELSNDLRHWILTRKPGQGPRVGQGQYRASSFECGLDSTNQVGEVVTKLVASIQKQPLGATNVNVVEKDHVTHTVSTISFDLSDKQTLKAILSMEVSKEKPWTMQVEGSEAIVASGGAQVLVKGFVEGLVLDRETGSLTQPDFNTSFLIDERIRDLVSRSLGGCAKEQWQ